MERYVKVYLDYFDYKVQSEVICEACQGMAVEVHHIYGRGKGMDVIGNLIALCRKCHDRAHGTKHFVTKDDFQYIHNYFLTGKRKTFLK
jgi:predicted restriction endonuclease